MSISDIRISTSVENISGQTCVPARSWLWVSFLVVLAGFLIPALSLAQWTVDDPAQPGSTGSVSVFDGQHPEGVDAWRIAGVPGELYNWIPWALRDHAAILRCTPSIAAGMSLAPT